MDHQAMTDAMREAIAAALHPFVSTADHEPACTAVIDAFKTRLVEDLPAIMLEASKTPESVAAMSTAFTVPLLREIEDGFNDDHDSKWTPVADRPGLRRAARTIREIRRAVEADPTCKGDTT